ncbi:MAG: hypothetical protein M3Y65_12565 [Pseudomonadota bacterium]|nr:hypothetical protein [Pseudomonadota bacterium]
MLTLPSTVLCGLRRLVMTILLGASLSQASVAAAGDAPVPVPSSAPAPVAVAPASAAAEQTRNQQKAAPGDAPTPAQCNESYPPDAAVTAVQRIDYREIESTLAGGGNDKKNEQVAELRHGLMLTVVNLAAVIQLQKCGAKPRALTLFLGGRPMPGLNAYPPVDPGQNKIIFLLKRTPENRAEWAQILGHPTLGEMKLSVSAGFADSYAMRSGQVIWFRAISPGWLTAWALLMLLFAVIILWAGRTTGMLRDSNLSVDGHPAMFSLARVQMAFWTFIILCSFVFVGMITGDYFSTMNENVLGLMGISVGASLGASIIDGGTSKANALPIFVTTGHWWRDILSDGTGISIHRFQMVAWTVVLGIVFLHEVYVDLAMPKFDAVLLGLLGISAGTYLGLKVVVEGSAKPGP